MNFMAIGTTMCMNGTPGHGSIMANIIFWAAIILGGLYAANRKTGFLKKMF